MHIQEQEENASIIEWLQSELQSVSTANPLPYRVVPLQDTNRSDGKAVRLSVFRYPEGVENQQQQLSTHGRGAAAVPPVKNLTETLKTLHESCAGRKRSLIVVLRVQNDASGGSLSSSSRRDCVFKAMRQLALYSMEYGNAWVGSVKFGNFSLKGKEVSLDSESMKALNRMITEAISYEGMKDIWQCFLGFRVQSSVFESSMFQGLEFKV